MDQPRRDARDSLMLLAAMRLADHPATLRIKVRNLSKGGMMAESAVHPVAGERLAIELRNLGWVNATVAWVAANRFGVVFDREIDCKAVRVSNDSPSPEGFVPRAVGPPGKPLPEGGPSILRRV